MDELVKALAPAFACGLGVQQALELADVFIGAHIGGQKKKVTLGWLSLALGVAITWFGEIRVLNVLAPTKFPLEGAVAPLFDVIVSALIISAGTEGFNSILKFLLYKKEEQKAETNQQQQQSPTASGINRQPAPPDVTLPVPAVV